MYIWTNECYYLQKPIFATVRAWRSRNNKSRSAAAAAVQLREIGRIPGQAATELAERGWDEPEHTQLDTKFAKSQPKYAVVAERGARRVERAELVVELPKLKPHTKYAKSVQPQHPTDARPRVPTN